MGRFNFHTHSHYCDGSDHPEEYIKSAIEAGFHSLGFSSHAPVPFKNSFAIKSKEKLIEYCHTIRGLSEEYEGDINIFLSLEIDFIPGLMPEFCELSEGCGLDYVIGSVHLVRKDNSEDLWFIDGPKAEIYDQGLKESFNGDIKEAVTAYYHQINHMVDTQKPDIVGHLDKVKMHNKGRYFSEEDSWYLQLVNETLDLIKKVGTIVEVNTRGIYKKRSGSLFPGVELLKKILTSEIPITLSSDAHKPREVDGYYAETRKILKEIGFKELMVFDGEAWNPEWIE